MKRIILFFLFSLAIIFKAASAQPNLIGQSPNSNTLKVSPDGKWLLATTEVNNAVRYSGPIRLSIWNSSKYQTRTRKIQLGEYDLSGWTDDNRLYYLHLINPNYPYLGKLKLRSWELEKPDGSGRVVHEISQKEGFKDFAFSADASRFFLLTDFSYQIYNTQSGKLLSRRLWNKVGQPIYYSIEEAHLSPHGERILAIELKTGWTTGSVVLEANTGKTLARIPAGHIEAQITSGDFLDENTLANVEGDQGMSDVTQTIYRASDGKVVGTRILPRFFYGLLTKDELILTDLRTLKTVKYMPPRGAWRDITISPDRKTLYVIDVDGKIFHFPAH